MQLNLGSIDLFIIVVYLVAIVVSRGLTRADLEFARSALRGD